MFAAATGALLALSLAAPGTPPLLVAQATPRTDVLLMGALPPAPENVTLQTRMFGTVAVPHKTHLDLRVSCKACHGPGPVGKIEFESPKAAHNACVSCHKEEQAGPVSCRDCHNVPLKPDPAAIIASQSPESPQHSAPPTNTAATPADQATAALGATAVPPAAPGAAVATAAPVQPRLASASAGAPLASAPLDGGGPELEPGHFTRSVEVGFISLADSGGVVVGPALNVKARSGDVLYLHSLASAGGSRHGHTLALVGAGLVTRVAKGWNVSAVGLGGIDASYRESQMFPALGLRLEADWAAPARVFQAFSVSFTFVADLTRPRNRYGDRVGGVIYGLTFTGAMRKR